MLQGERGRTAGCPAVQNHMWPYEHPDVFENLRMRCNVVLKAAHGQPAAFDIDHTLIHLVETVESERMSFVYMPYWSEVTKCITIRHITIFNIFKRHLLCA